MEVKKENYLIRQEIFTFLNNRETLKTSLNFRNISVNIQSYLKKDDNIHIFFSKKLSDEFLFNLLGKENKQPVKRFNRKTASAFLKFAEPSKESSLSSIKFTQRRHKRSASLLESLAYAKGRGLSLSARVKNAAAKGETGVEGEEV